MNSRNKRKLAYRAKNEKAPTICMQFGNYGDYLDDKQAHKNRQIDITKKSKLIQHRTYGGTYNFLKTGKVEEITNRGYSCCKKYADNRQKVSR